MKKDEGLRLYSQWLNVFKDIKQNHNLSSYIPLFQKSKLEDKRYSLPYYVEELNAFLKHDLTYMFSVCNQQLAYHLSYGDVASCKVVLCKLNNHLRNLRVFSTLPFLPNKTKREIDKSICENQGNYYKDLNSHIRESKAYCAVQISYLLNTFLYRLEKEDV